MKILKCRSVIIGLSKFLVTPKLICVEIGIVIFFLVV